MSNKSVELVQYFIVNSDLNMSTGKIAAQVAHAAVYNALKCITEEKEIYLDWYKSGQTKIVLKANEKDLLKLIEKGFEGIRDSGRTEIEPNSLTVVGLPPMMKSEAQKYVRRFRLY